MITKQPQKISKFEEIWQRLDSLPEAKTEESLLFRILVQILVIVGIIATDIAGGTYMSLWAIPFSIMGAAWSWYRRKHRNITAKFLIAIGMLLMMLLFFGNLFQSLNDTRLVLAELLVQLQVLHSFDLPRRKDLGYSMVIGLILLGVAGTVSQTLTFAPWLLLFLMVALPVLILDYRSRLGLATLDALFFQRQSQSGKKQQQSWWQYYPLAPKRLGLFLAIILAIGLIIFAIMPRFPGYQLQSLPVSSPTGFEEKTFEGTNQGIVNPGYVREGEEGSGIAGQGNSPTKGAGDMDDEFYYGFNSTINQNLRGNMKKKLVMRVRSQAPGFWRVLAFDRYTGQGWEISRNSKVAKIKRPAWSYRFYVSIPVNAPKTKKIIQTYSAVVELPNIIPALSYPNQLYFPTREIAIDPEGSLRSPVGIVEGLTYTVVSDVPYRDRTALGKAGTTYAKTFQKYYLQIPPEIQDLAKAKAEQLLAKSPKPLTSNYEKALYLAQAIKQSYTIQPELPFFSDEDDLVKVFLERYQGGYPDHFSTVYTMMLRSLGIPARLAVGFGPGQFNPFTGYYLVHNTDAYALTEVYFPKYGWFAFDPIPGHEVIPPSFEEYEAFGVLRQFWQWVAGWLPSPISAFIANLWTVTVEFLAKITVWLWRFFSGSLLGLITGLIAIIAIAFFSWLGLSQLRQWLYQRRLAKLPPIERLYQQLLLLLKNQGYAKKPAQTPLEYVQISYQQQQPAAAEIIDEICQAYVRWRYGGQIANMDYLQGQFQILQRSFNRRLN